MSDTKKSNELPVTQEMLYQVRDELKSDIATLRLETKSGFSDVATKIEALTAEVKSQNAKIHRMLTLYEEQENRNKYVLDGYTSLNDRIEKLEQPI